MPPGNKSLPEPMLTQVYCQMMPLATKILRIEAMAKPQRNKPKWIKLQNRIFFSQENAFEYVVCKMAAILFRPQCAKVWNLQNPMPGRKRAPNKINTDQLTVWNEAIIGGKLLQPGIWNEIIHDKIREVFHHTWIWSWICSTIYVRNLMTAIRKG